MPTDTVVGFTGIDIGGVSGGTQFLTVQVYMTLWYGAGSRPTDVGYYLSDGSCSGPRSNIYFVTIPNSAPSNTSASIGWTEAVDTGTTHVAGLCAFTNGSADHVANVGSFTIQATTSPFGSGGGDTLSPQSASFGGAAATPSGPSQPSGRRAP